MPPVPGGALPVTSAAKLMDSFFELGFQAERISRVAKEDPTISMRQTVAILNTLRSARDRIRHIAKGDPLPRRTAGKRGRRERQKNPDGSPPSHIMYSSQLNHAAAIEKSLGIQFGRMDTEEGRAEVAILKDQAATLAEAIRGLHGRTTDEYHYISDAEERHIREDIKRIRRGEKSVKWVEPEHRYSRHRCGVCGALSFRKLKWSIAVGPDIKKWICNRCAGPYEVKGERYE